MQDVYEHYTSAAKWLHWIMAALIITVWTAGVYLADLPKGPDKTQWIQWHKAIGSVVLPLLVARIAWRFTHQPPALPSSIPALQQIIAHAAHWALYGSMLAQPLSGWAMSSAFGYPVKMAGFITLPFLLDKDEALGKELVEVHEIIGWTLGILVAGHILMALKHHFFDQDTVLLRMAPRHAPKAD